MLPHPGLGCLTLARYPTHPGIYHSTPFNGGRAHTGAERVNWLEGVLGIQAFLRKIAPGLGKAMLQQMELRR